MQIYTLTEIYTATRDYRIEAESIEEAKKLWENYTRDTDKIMQSVEYDYLEDSGYLLEARDEHGNYWNEDDLLEA